MRILVAGDTHGNLQHAKYLVERAKFFDCQVIIVVGDFGYWEHEASGVYFLNWIEDAAKRTGIVWCFIDGNHENHTLLRFLYMGQLSSMGLTETLKSQANFVESKRGPFRVTVTKDGFYAIRQGLYYIPRGTVWTWEGVRFLGLGGAFSVDINWRKPGTSWWPEEMIEPDEVDALREVGKVDVFLSHDAPAEVDMMSIFAQRSMEFWKADQRSSRNRALVSKAMEYSKPDVAIHGHFHLRHVTYVTLENGHEVKVMGLDRDGTEQSSFTVLDLKEDVSD